MADQETYRIRDLVRLTGLTVRAIRHYVAMRLVTSAKRRGPATAYTREQLVRLQVIALLRRRDRLSIPTIKARLAGLTCAQLEAMLPKPDPPPKPPTPPEPVARGAVRWDHVPLIPGLELCVRSDAGPLVHRLAREIATNYRSDPT